MKNQGILDELQTLNEQREAYEKLISEAGHFAIEDLKGLVIFLDKDYDESKLSAKCNKLKNELAKLKLKLVNKRIQYLIKNFK